MVENTEVREGRHWADSEWIREAFLKAANSVLSLGEEEVYEALGVSELREFKGTLDNAIDALVWWVFKDD